MKLNCHVLLKQRKHSIFPLKSAEGLDDGTLKKNREFMQLILNLTLDIFKPLITKPVW